MPHAGKSPNMKAVMLTFLHERRSSIRTYLKVHNATLHIGNREAQADQPASNVILRPRYGDLLKPTATTLYFC